jgi:hypothetical protein
MRSENGLAIDPEALGRVLTAADVLTIGFTLFPHRLLIDTRSNASTPQFAGMVEPVANMQERYLWLGQHRGSLGAPQAFSFFVWPHSVATLRQRDVLGPLLARLDNTTREYLDIALDQAARLERAGTIAAIRGDEAWPALWERAH